MLTPIRNRKYRRYITSLPCAVCDSRRGVEAAHTGPRGLSQKTSDFSCIPLCYRHHKTANDSLHAIGPRRFAQVHGIDIPALVARLNQQIPLFGSQHRFGRKEASPEFLREHCSCGWRTSWYRLEADARAALHHHIDSQEPDEDEDPEKTAYLLQTYGDGGWR